MNTMLLAPLLGITLVVATGCGDDDGAADAAADGGADAAADGGGPDSAGGDGAPDGRVDGSDSGTVDAASDGGDAAVDASSDGGLGCPEDDRLEPNDSRTAAAPLALAAPFDGIVCANSDYFEVSVPVGCGLTVDVDFVHADGDIDLLLYDADDTLVAFSDSEADNEHLATDPLMPGNYYVRVRPFGPVDNTYRLTAELTCLACPGDDTHEPDDAPAADVPLRGPAFGVLCGNPDHFAVAAVAGCSVVAELTPHSATTSQEVAVLDGSGTPMGGAPPATGARTVRVTAAASGLHYAYVAGSGSGTRYQLEVAFECSGVCPTDDASEPNDDYLTAVPITSGADATGHACNGNLDLLSFDTHSFCSVDLEIWNDRAAGGVRLELLDTDATVVLATVEATTGHAMTTFNLLSDGTRYARLTSLGAGAGSTYYVRFTERCP